MKIAALGPEGTFSHMAVMKYDKGASIQCMKTIWDVFNAVKLHDVEKGIVPLENSVSGSVGLTLDALMEFDLEVCGEIILPINHVLVGNGKMDQLRYVYSHPIAFAQCQKFAREHFHDVEVRHTSSSAKAAELLTRQDKAEYGAIVSELSMQRYGLKMIKKGIQDTKFNVTRFFVLNAESAKRTGNDRTSIAIYPHMDKPGLLYTLIGEFAKRKINLTKIESRPSKGRLGDYIFFIDLQGHKDDKKVQEAFEEIEKHFFVKIMGSYPREY